VSEKYCPNCKEKSFVWAIDEEESQNTLWYCSLCKYHVEENEALVSECKVCETKTNLYMKSDSEYFQFCLNCQTKLEIEQW